MTNVERRVNVLRKAVDPPFALPSDFEILLDFARRMDLRDRDGACQVEKVRKAVAASAWHCAAA